MDSYIHGEDIPPGKKTQQQSLLQEKPRSCFGNKHFKVATVMQLFSELLYACVFKSVAKYEGKILDNKVREAA